jgi:hypothetical protein
MTEQNAIVTWAVELHCDHTTLLRWQELFSDRTTAAVRLENGDDRRPRWFLHSAQFDGLPDTSIHKAAEQLLAVLNGAAQVHGVLDGAGKVHGFGWKVTMGLPTYIRADGTRKSMQNVTSDHTIPAEFGAVPDYPGVATQPQKLDAQRWAKLAEQNKDIAAALAHFVDDWHELYETLEVIRRDLPRPSNPKDKPRLEDQGWGITKEEAEALSNTLSHHRHQKGPLPSLNMDEARYILRRAIQGWLKTK